jgi:hypothetical protein
MVQIEKYEGLMGRRDACLTGFGYLNLASEKEL